MVELLTSEAFVASATILLSAGFGIFVRSASRNDNYQTLVMSDFAVGLEILIAMLILLASKSIDYLLKIEYLKHDELYRAQLNEQMTISVYGLLGLLVAIWMVSTLIRRKGWNNDAEPNLTWGVVVPNLLSINLMFLFFYLFNFLLK